MPEKKDYRKDFLEAIWDQIYYWENNDRLSRKEIIEGITHSILSIIDGGHLDAPGFKMIPTSNPKAKDIAGSLASLLYTYKPRR